MRHAIIRLICLICLIRDHTAADPEDLSCSWREYDFDFTGVVFDGGTG